MDEKCSNYSQIQGKDNFWQIPGKLDNFTTIEKEGNPGFREEGYLAIALTGKPDELTSDWISCKLNLISNSAITHYGKQDRHG
jgi:hypothetical protein